MHQKTKVLCLAWLLTAAAGAHAGCGGDDFENEPRPAAAETLTGVVQDGGVTVEPDDRGAGPFVITISNQTDEAHTLTLEGESVKETVGPVQPMDTATIQATLEPGSYEVRAGSAKTLAKEIPPAELTIGPPRDSSADQLLLP
jgi:hypothetical protein